MKKYEDYLTENFGKFFPEAEIPFPQEYLDSIWRRQLEFAQNFDEFKRNILEAFIWIERFKNGEIDGRRYKWRDVPLSSLRMIIDCSFKGERNFLFARDKVAQSRL